MATDAAWGGPEGEDADLNEVPSEEGSASAAAGLGWLRGGVNRFDVEGELLSASDITVWGASGSFEQERGAVTVGATLAYTAIDIDYREPGTFAAERNESNTLGQLDLGWQSGPDVELTGLVRYYDGYPDYRAVWIAEYYEQLFGFVPGYEEPDPRGWAVGAGAVWDVVPGATRLTFEAGFGEDDVVEGWEFGAGMAEPGRSTLETISGGVIWEQALNGWLKMENSLRVQEVTAREPRFQVQTSWAAALGPDWTLRAEAGASRERPDFEAYYAGGLVDYEFLPGWHASVNARYYEDTGEIESAGFSTAAPGMQAFELGASLLYDAGDVAVRLYGGFYSSDFEPLDETNEFFANLYRDRDWWVARLAVTYSF